MTIAFTPSALFAAPQVRMMRRDDGAILLDSPIPLAPGVRSIGTYLEHWATLAPDRSFLMERDAHGHWAGVTYGQARDKVYRIATWLLAQDIPPGRPVVVLSDNSIEHGLLMLACMHVGIAYSAISPSYSLVSKDHAKLTYLIRTLEPAILYVADPAPYAIALAAIDDLHDATLVVSAERGVPDGVVRFPALLASLDEAAVAARFAQVGPDTVAKILFTSGSTSDPKGVINTQRMLCSTQQAKAQLWPFLAVTPPVLLDWLPWNHTFGSNHNFNLIIAHGGTLYIDAGKPMPGAFEISVRNLRDIAPTLYLNVPRGFDMLVPMLQGDAALRKQFFSRLQVIFYAAAALPQHLWDAIQALSLRELGHVVPMVTAWGSTETAPLATDCHFQAARSGVIGLPIPGVTLKLVPNGDKLEVRVKGPNVTPGYFKQPALSAAAFDADGFYMIGDAVRFVDPDAPHLGLLFDGRVTEDFKLSSGTWVNVGALRLNAIGHLAPIAQDVVVAGHDRMEIGFLIVPNVAACRQLAGLGADVPVAQVVAHPAVTSRVITALAALRSAGTGSSTFATRALLLDEPLAVDDNEITDKGYVNQGAVLKKRAALVGKLYAEHPHADVLVL